MSQNERYDFEIGIVWYSFNFWFSSSTPSQSITNSLAKRRKPLCTTNNRFVLMAQYVKCAYFEWPYFSILSPISTAKVFSNKMGNNNDDFLSELIFVWEIFVWMNATWKKELKNVFYRSPDLLIFDYQRSLFCNSLDAPYRHNFLHVSDYKMWNKRYENFNEPNF